VQRHVGRAVLLRRHVGRRVQQNGAVAALRRDSDRASRTDVQRQQSKAMHARLQGERYSIHAMEEITYVP
jgi:hypothetical protein